MLIYDWNSCKQYNATGITMDSLIILCELCIEQVMGKKDTMAPTGSSRKYGGIALFIVCQKFFFNLIRMI